MAWNNTYNPGEIGNGVISEDRPGSKIAAAITEIQERVFNRARIDAGVGLIASAERVGNELVLRIELAASSPEYSDEGGEDQEEVRTDGFTGLVYSLTGAYYDYSLGAIVFDMRSDQYEDGILKESDSSAWGNLTVPIPSGIPSGGSQYHVLQRGEGNAVEWGPVRFPT